jgi:hypothetical protein
MQRFRCVGRRHMLLPMKGLSAQVYDLVQDEILPMRHRPNLAKNSISCQTVCRGKENAETQAPIRCSAQTEALFEVDELQEALEHHEELMRAEELHQLCPVQDHCFSHLPFNTAVHMQNAWPGADYMAEAGPKAKFWNTFSHWKLI